MFALERQKIILDQLKENGAVLVSKLSQELGVTEETVRRDLEKLEAKELLIRTHGGAIPLENTKMELSLEGKKGCIVKTIAYFLEKTKETERNLTHARTTDRIPS